MKKVLFNLEWRVESNDGKYPLSYASAGTVFDHLFTDLLNKYKGDFFIDIGKDCIGLEFFHDFPQIFKSIPDILLRMIKNGEQVEFSFTEPSLLQV